MNKGLVIQLPTKVIETAGVYMKCMYPIPTAVVSREDPFVQ